MQPETTTETTIEHHFHLGTGEKQLATLPPDASVLDAVRLMRNRHIGDVIIVESRNTEVHPIGIVTDRDLCLEVLSQCADPEFLRISAVMTRELVTCPLGAGIFQMIGTMKEKGVSRMILVSETGALKGIVTAKGLMQVLSEGFRQLSMISENQRLHELKVQH